MNPYRTNRPRALALLISLGLAVPALAQVYDSRMDDRIMVERSSFGPPPPGTRYEARIGGLPSAIHSGANNPADDALATSVAAALAADPRIHGATITVAANDGNVSLAGSAKSPEQAGYAENIARGVAGVMAVSGTLDSQGG